jgi:propane monooxygenase coupling protein
MTAARSHGDRCGVTLSASREGNAIADLMDLRPGVTVMRFPAMIRIEAERVLEFDLKEIAEWLGQHEFSAYDLQVELSSGSGRLVLLDDRVLTFANPEDAAEYLGLAGRLDGAAP